MKTLAALLLSTISITAADYYASPNGNGDGTEANPFSLNKALLAGTIPADSTLLLKGGTYWGPIGSTATRLTVKSAPGEVAVFDIAGPPFPVKRSSGLEPVLQIRAGPITFQDIIIQCSSTDRRRVTMPANDQTRPFVRPSGIDVGTVGDGAPDVRLIGLIIHDVGVGIAGFDRATDMLVDSCIIYNWGYDVDDGHIDMGGHAIYVQNSTGTKTIRRNLIYGGAAYGVHGYGDAGVLRNIVCEDNIIFQTGIMCRDLPYDDPAPWAGKTYRPPFPCIFFGTLDNAMNNIAVNGNICYQDPDVNNGFCVQLGIRDRLNGGVECNNNVLYGAKQTLYMHNWQTIGAQGNVLFGNFRVMQLPDGKWPGVDRNIYYAPALDGASPNPTNHLRTLNSGQRYNWAAWRDAVADANSTYGKGKPTGGRVYVKPTSFSKRAHVAVFNHDLADAVEIDAATILSSGDTYVVKNARDPLGPAVLSGLWDGTSKLRLPMNNSVAAPHGLSAPPSATKLFNAFIVASMGSLIVTNPPAIPPIATNQPTATNIVGIYITNFVTATLWQTNTVTVTETLTNTVTLLATNIVNVTNMVDRPISEVEVKFGFDADGKLFIQRKQ